MYYLTPSWLPLGFGVQEVFALRLMIFEGLKYKAWEGAMREIKRLNQDLGAQCVTFQNPEPFQNTVPENQDPGTP